MKFCAPSREHLSEHYADLSTKKFFPGLIDYMSSGPVIAMVWEGMNVVLAGRKMLGATKPQDSEPGTIRGDYCIDVGRCVPRPTPPRCCCCLGLSRALWLLRPATTRRLAARCGDLHDDCLVLK
jgi:hypothetical protein|eukprot:SAG25_NODE_70_length_17370_cov_11.748885_11_plen_124_part_00